MFSLKNAAILGVVAGLTIWCSQGLVNAHEAARYHVHGGASLPPDFESFAIGLVSGHPYATTPNIDRTCSASTSICPMPIHRQEIVSRRR